MSKAVGHQITKEDFLYLAEEVEPFIQLVQLKESKGDAVLGYAGQATVEPIKMLRGFIKDAKKKAVPTPQGWVAEAAGRIACVSSKDFSKEDLKPDTRIFLLTEGKLFHHTHIIEYIHLTVSIYHEIELILPSSGGGGTLEQPDSTLDYVPTPTQQIVPAAAVVDYKLLGF